MAHTRGYGDISGMNTVPQRCVVLAAGRGTRLGKLTLERPKPMIPIAGRPLLEYILRNIAEATSIREFCLVVRYRADSIIRYFDSASAFGWRIRYVHQQDDQPGTAAALRAALEELPSEPVLMSFGDILTDPVNYTKLLAAYNCRVSAVIGVNWLPDVSEGGGVWLDGDRVIRLQEKPRNADTNWNLAGVHIFSGDVLPVLRNLLPSARGEYEITDAIQTLLIHNSNAVRAVRFEGYWNDVGTPQRLYEAQRYLAGLYTTQREMNGEIALGGET